LRWTLGKTSSSPDFGLRIPDFGKISAVITEEENSMFCSPAAAGFRFPKF
jgi:hypothetical protein